MFDKKTNMITKGQFNAYIQKHYDGDVGWSDVDGQNIYHAECQKGNLKIVQYLDKAKMFNPNQVDNNQSTALLLAVAKGRIEMVKYLLSNKKTNKAHKDEDGNNAFLLACDGGYLEIVKLLVEKYNFKMDYINEEGHDGYFLAFDNSHVNIMKYIENNFNKKIISQKEEMNDWYEWLKLKCECDPYIYSARYDQVENMIYLDKYYSDKINANMKDDDLYLYCARNGLYRVMGYLESINWDVTVTNQQGHNAYILALFSANNNVINHIEKNSNYYIPKGSIGRRWHELIQIYGEPYTKSIKKDNVTLMIYLDTNYDCFNFLSRTNLHPYFLALENDCKNAVNYFEKTHSCNFETKNLDGYNCYLSLISEGNLDKMKKIEDKFGDEAIMNVRDKSGNDALLLACKLNKLNVAKYLIEIKKWNITTINNYGHDIFKLAGTYPNTPMYKYLETKKLYFYFKPLRIDIEPGLECTVCRGEFTIGEKISFCHNNHIIHTSCYCDYLTQKGEKDERRFNCIICNDKMVNMSLIFGKEKFEYIKKEDQYVEKEKKSVNTTIKDKKSKKEKKIIENIKSINNIINNKYIPFISPQRITNDTSDDSEPEPYLVGGGEDNDGVW